MRRCLLTLLLLLPGLACPELSRDAEAITIGRVVADGNVNVRSAPEVRPDNVVGFLPDGATVIIFDKTAQPDTIDGVVDYWYETHSFAYTSWIKEWVFGYFLEIEEVAEFKTISDLKAAALKYYPTELLGQITDSLKAISSVGIDNIDTDTNWEIFVEYQCRGSRLFYVLDGVNASSKYNKMLIVKTVGASNDGEWITFKIAKNLIGTSNKELIVAKHTSGPDIWSINWIIWTYINGTWQQCGETNVEYEHDSGEYNTKLLYVNLDNDLELEIQSSGLMKNEENFFIIKETYDFNGTEYVRISRTETPTPPDKK